MNPGTVTGNDEGGREVGAPDTTKSEGRDAKEQRYLQLGVAYVAARDRVLFTDGLEDLVYTRVVAASHCISESEQLVIGDVHESGYRISIWLEEATHRHGRLHGVRLRIYRGSATYLGTAFLEPLLVVLRRVLVLHIRFNQSYCLHHECLQHSGTSEAYVPGLSLPYLAFVDDVI
jgi:hypothetical protein